MKGRPSFVEKLGDLIVISLYLLIFDCFNCFYGQNYQRVLAKFLSSFSSYRNSQHEEFAESLRSFLASQDQCFLLYHLYLQGYLFSSCK